MHSNSFLDGPFDGTGLAARAVDRAHAAGIFWTNSAGNYARRHWQGMVGDPDRDGWTNIGPGGRGYLTFPLTAGIGMGATLYWSNCTRNGAPIQASSARFRIDVTDTAPSAPLVYAQGQNDARLPSGAVGFLPAVTGSYGLRVDQGTAGAVCDLELFGGGVELGDEATMESSIPTPGDARGSFTVGAREWAADSAAPYSSQGPTQDGRLKPDVVAPASTAIAPGIAMVGTSASAPHAAGAAALLMQRNRAAGTPSDPDTIAGELIAGALEIAPAGPDQVTGAGRIRLDLDPPAIGATLPAAGQPVGESARFAIAADDAGTIDVSGVAIDGVPVAEAEGLLARRLDTSALAPGPHTAVFWVRDLAGNRSELPVAIVRDATPPVVAVAASGSALAVTVSDAEARSGSLAVQLDDGPGGQRWQRSLPLTFAAGVARARIAAPALARGERARAHPGARRGGSPLRDRHGPARGSGAALMLGRGAALDRRLARSLLPPAVVLDVSFVNGLEAIRSLAATGAPVVAVDHRPGALGFRSRLAHHELAPGPARRGGLRRRARRARGAPLLGARGGLPDA